MTRHEPFHEKQPPPTTRWFLTIIGTDGRLLDSVLAHINEVEKLTRYEPTHDGTGYHLVLVYPGDVVAKRLKYEIDDVGERTVTIKSEEVRNVREGTSDT